MVHKILKKLGLALASTLILATMSAGIAAAKPQSEEYQNQQLYTSVAFTLSQSNNHVTTFKSMPQETQDKIANRLKVLYKQMELADDVATFYHSLTPAEQMLIDLDSTNMSVAEGTYTFDAHNHDITGALNDENNGTRGIGVTYSVSSCNNPTASPVTTCTYNIWSWGAYAGTISGESQFNIHIYAYYLHTYWGMGYLEYDGSSVIVSTFNGYELQSKDLHPKTRAWLAADLYEYGWEPIIAWVVSGEAYVKRPGTLLSIWGCGLVTGVLNAEYGTHFTSDIPLFWFPSNNAGPIALILYGTYETKLYQLLEWAAALNDFQIDWENSTYINL